ncbi:hypothetical protein FRC96_03375 [Lujinxingia vulgaris]|uniref:Uncharacterized protein n=1 Tax=Lujinxingia vulgaris TaxID=2600176 RepID=A0A5C6XK97_9DELT|nr:tetratricopeptide repeat protein [Lujinxingia vulgaris]TXD42719.1 hypothetical protein FRC96_03375 [Lujinxingia vulgaris]
MSRTLLVSLVIALLLSACAHPLQRGRSALDEENYERAEAIAQNAVERRSDDPRGHLLYAEVLVAQKRYAEALPYARRAAHGEAEGATALTLYGDILGKLEQDPQLRARAYDRALELDPDALPQARFIESLQALTQSQLSPWDEPERLWAIERLFQIDPNFVADLDPQTLARQMYVVAQVHAAKGDLKEAVVYMGNAIARFGDPDELAAADLERAQRAHEWRFEMGELHLRRGHRREALESWKTYLEGVSELRAESPQAQLAEADRRYLSVGQSARYYGDAELAAGIWRAAVGLEAGDVLEGVELPEHPSPAVIAERLGRLELMREEPAAYARIAEDSSRGFADAHDRAMLRASGAQCDVAPEALEAFVMCFENRRDVRSLLVERLIDAGEYDAAMVVAQQGISALPTGKNLELGMKAALYAAQPSTFIALFGRRRVISDGVTRFLGAHDAENVDAEAARLLAASVGEADAATVAAAASYLREIRPSDIELFITHLRALMATGDADGARQEVRDFLDQREPTPRLRHDVAEALAGKVDDGTMEEILGWFEAQP